MSQRIRISFALALALAPPARAQFAVAHPPVPKSSPPLATVPASGGYLGGTDDCGQPHVNLGGGTVVDVPFTTGTTGNSGQNEALCYAFGGTGVTNDVWFDWTAMWTGPVVMRTCVGTAVDTKIVVWPLVSGCPADGTALACDDNFCFPQSWTRWAATQGTSYTLQLGTHPGSLGGWGTFEVVQNPPPPCGTYDDGTSENSLGLVNGGETGWLHYQDCLVSIDLIETAYETVLGCTLFGNASRIVAYEDADCDADPTTPASGMTLLWSVATTVTNACTDILNAHPYPGAMGGTFTNLAPSGCTWVMATTVQPAGAFPAPMDQTNPTLNAWVVGDETSAGGMLDLTNLNNNNVPPLQTSAIGFPTAWLLRAHGIERCGGALVFPVGCLSDPCPCGNGPELCAGCTNSLGAGATLRGTGNASLAGDSLVLNVFDTPDQPGLFFQGDQALSPAPSFGDGLRCCGQNVVRLGTWLPSGHVTNTAAGQLVGGIGPPIAAHPGNAGLQAGDQRCYQWWHRDPVNGPCGSGFNLSNSVLVVWGA